MSQEDFDLASMAAYLHLTPQQVERLAQRDKVPGRKVGGQWRFSSAEIHHWMEDRIGLADDSELSQVEDALDRSATVEHEPEICITRLLTPDRIVNPLLAKTKNSVIRAMVTVAADSGVLWDPDRMDDAIKRREELASTAMDNGVALLHPRRPLPDALAEGFLALGISQQGVPFGGSHVLTSIFFLLGSTDDRSHLRTLARLTRLISDAGFLYTLRQSETPADAFAVLVAREAEVG